VKGRFRNAYFVIGQDINRYGIGVRVYLLIKVVMSKFLAKYLLTLIYISFW